MRMIYDFKENDRKMRVGLFRIGLAVAGATSAPAFAADSNSSPAGAHGKALYESCAPCHSLAPNVTGIGPTLYGVFGRKAGTLASFRFSPALKRSDITWDAKTLDSFIENPQHAVSGNRMPFSGMKEAADRAALIDYLGVAAAPAK